MGATIGSLVAVPGTILGGYDAQYQGETNKKLADMAAADALHRGNLAASMAQAKGTKTIGSATVALAASGIDTQTGSALKAQVDSRLMSDLDAATIRNNAAREAWGFKMKGMEALDQGKAALARAKSSALTNGTQAATSDASSFANIFGK